MTASDVPVELASNWESLGTCAYSNKKPYMDWKAITNTQSTQYKYIQEHMTIHSDGLLRTHDNHIGVALGSQYGAIGSKYKIVTDTGNEFLVVKIDEKSDNHTTNGCQDASGAMIEFVVDVNIASVSEHAKSIYDGSFNSSVEFHGTVVDVQVKR